MYLRQHPGVPLAQYVEMLWSYEGYQATHRRERVLPNGRFQLIIDLAAGRGTSIIVGMRTRSSILETEVLQSLQSKHTNDLDVSSSRDHWHFEECRNEQGVSQDVVFR
jgi:hypothetical protein